MAALRSLKAWISPGALGRPAAVRKYLLRRGHGKLRCRGSDWEICFANLRRGIEIPDCEPTRRHRVRRLSEANPKPHGYEFRIELWDRFLKGSGGCARPRLCSTALS